MESPLTQKALAQQEEIFRESYEKGDIDLARALYHPDLVYVSPTFRIIDRPSWIMTGIEAGLEFIQATLSGIQNIRYEAVSTAIVLMEFQAVGMCEDHGVDRHFITAAASERRPIRALETVQSQLEVLDGQ